MLIRIGALCLGMLMTVGSQGAHAKEYGSIVTGLKDYGIPCALSLGLSVALVKQDPLMVGLVGCGVSSSVMYLQNGKNKPLEAEEETNPLDNKIKTELDANNKKLTKQFGDAIKKVLEEQDKTATETRKITREVLAERTVSIEDDLKREMKSQFEKGEMFGVLEKKMVDRVKDEVKSEVRAMKKEIIKETSEDVISQVTARPVEVKSSQKRKSLEELDEEETKPAKKMKSKKVTKKDETQAEE